MDIEPRYLIAVGVMSVLLIAGIVQHFRLKAVIGSSLEDLANKYTPEILKPRPLPTRVTEEADEIPSEEVNTEETNPEEG